MNKTGKFLIASAVSIVFLFAGVACNEVGGGEDDEFNNNNGNYPGGKADGHGDDGKYDSFDWESIAARCSFPDPDEPVLTQSHFAWRQTIEEMGARYEEHYNAPYRMKDRAYWDPDKQEFVLLYQDKLVTLSRRIIVNTTMHIEKSLALKYVDYIYFSDMGHNHFFIPWDRWDNVYSQIPIAERDTFYNTLFDDPELRILYHTAEQLDMLDENNQVYSDRHIQWRYYTRNIVGDNKYHGVVDIIHNFSRAMNTAHDLEGHRYYGAGFYFGAHKDGCFPFVHEGREYYYDITFSYFPY